MTITTHQTKNNMEKVKIRVKDATTGDILTYECLTDSGWTTKAVQTNDENSGIIYHYSTKVIREVFTGYKDRAGLEIYENDTVRTAQGTGTVKKEGGSWVVELHGKDVCLSLSHYSVLITTKKEVKIEDVVKQVLENLAENPILSNLTISDLKSIISDHSIFINKLNPNHQTNKAILRLTAVCLQTLKHIQENEQ